MTTRLSLSAIVLAIAYCAAGCETGPGTSERTDLDGTDAEKAMGASTTETSSAVEPASPLRALLVTGGCCHDYDAQKSLIPSAVTERANVEWTVVHEGGTGRDHKLSVFADDSWTERFDVVVHNTCFGGLKDEDFVGSIVNGHRESGIGAVILHCGLHSYRNLESKRWHEFLGLSSMRHDPGAPVPVENARPDHPIMSTFPDAWTTPKDELYFVERTWPGLTVLAHAYSEKNKIHSPIIWTFQSGDARIFGASIGHSNATMEHPDYLDLVTRGLLWTTEKLEEDGSPAAGYGPVARPRAISLLKESFRPPVDASARSQRR